MSQAQRALLLELARVVEGLLLVGAHGLDIAKDEADEARLRIVNLRKAIEREP